ncbi:MAG: hypothetical protein LBR17_00825 [Bacteroidales bacterium]|jgi:hypothetical protein|nr:hypothetical protein [Bacteroidales bacterium]
MNVATNLFEYLKINDRAELYGFGTFVVTTLSAEFDKENNLLLPPRRILNFEKEEKNDMSFAVFMAKREFISEQTALTWIKQYADSLNEHIVASSRILVPSLGTICMNEEGEYSFEPLPDLDLMDESFGLDSVKNVKTFEIAEPNAEETIPEQPSVETNEPSDETIPQNNTDNTPKPQPYTTIVAELASEENEDIADLVEAIRTSADKILEVSQKLQQQQENNGNQNKRRPIFWKWLCILIFVLLISSAILVGSYYTGWLQKYKWSKPVAKVLSSYIMTRDEVHHKYDKPPLIPSSSPTVALTESQTSTIADTLTKNITMERLPVTSISQNQPKKSPKRQKKVQKDTATAKKTELTIDYNAIIQMRPTNKLGYDVIASTGYERINAEYNARKAKSLGYDGYIISRKRVNQPIYYVSYGSRQTLGEAKDLMQSMIDSMGGDYYIIARGETTNQ